MRVRAGQLMPLLVLVPMSASATSGTSDLTGTGVGFLALALFAVALLFVAVEEFTELRKSKPVVVAAGILWLLVAISWQEHGIEGAGAVLEHHLLEYGELLLFLLAAMTYVNTLEERNVFAALRSWLVARQLSLRSVFWITGLMSFCLSPLLDNLTTALVMGAVVLAMGRGNPAFIAPACVNIVVAANAGGAFSPFGDITTLMVWQKGILRFFEFFALFLPSLANWLVPAPCLSFAIPAGRPAADRELIGIKSGGYVIIALFALTIVMTVSAHHFAHLPAFLGMMTGLGLLQLYGYVIRRRELRLSHGAVAAPVPPGFKPATKPFDVFISLKRVEWDTLLFFYHVRRTQHRAGHVEGAVVARDSHGWGRRLAVVNWLSGGGRTHGPGARNLYVLSASQMDLGDRARIRSIDRCAHAHQHAPRLDLAVTGPHRFGGNGRTQMDQPVP